MLRITFFILTGLWAVFAVTAAYNEISTTAQQFMMVLAVFNIWGCAIIEGVYRIQSAIEKTAERRKRDRNGETTPVTVPMAYERTVYTVNRDNYMS